MGGFADTVTLKEITLKDSTVTIEFFVDSRSFFTEISYEDIDFNSLEKKYGVNFVQEVLVQMGCLVGLKYLSLAPRKFDLSAYSEYFTTDFIELLDKLYFNIFAQHRYENDLVDYEGPEIVTGDSLGKKVSANEVVVGKTPILLGNGGGKDSLVSMKLLERSNQRFSVFQYTYSLYGDETVQEELLHKLADTGAFTKKHTIKVVEDFLDLEKLQTLYPLKTFCDTETPVSLFQSLFYCLSEGYRFVSFGNERSANFGNFFWKKGNQDVNHQWGKGFEAETLLDTYIKKNLLSNFSYFSVLMPIHDYTIFHLLQKDEEHVHATSSCNVEKPWCLHCPKCVYVWLNYMAYLDHKKIPKELKKNLFDEEKVETLFLQMMGLKDHKPFECIGEIGETRLALLACYNKGMKGKIIDTFKEKILLYEDFEFLKKKYGTVYGEHRIPSIISESVLSQMESVPKTSNTPAISR